MYLSFFDAQVLSQYWTITMVCVEGNDCIEKLGNLQKNVFKKIYKNK